ncbi:hypothetical protein [Streptomyces sp. NPDC001999]
MRELQGPDERHVGHQLDPHAGDGQGRHHDAAAEAMVKLAAAAAATAGLVAGIAVAKAAPHVKRGLATIEVEFPARTTMLKQPPSELTTP